VEGVDVYWGVYVSLAVYFVVLFIALLIVRRGVAVEEE